MEETPNRRPRSWALIDLAAFRRNVARARKLAPAGRLLAVLKADAYGHGATHLAAAAQDAGVVQLGVGDSREGLRLRRAGIHSPILVLGDLVPEEISRVVAEDLEVAVHSEGRLNEVEAEARRQGRRVGIHLKVDTGLGRLGMAPERVLPLAHRVDASAWLDLRGLMSHLACAGRKGKERNRWQSDRFSSLVRDLAEARLSPPRIHLRASAGLLDEGVPGETLARAGALLYGFTPLGAKSHFEPVLSLETQIVFLKDVPAGSGVGYGATVVTERKTRLGIIPFGYHDGLRRELARRGAQVLVCGQRAPLLGQISMDYATLDITDVPGTTVGDRVTLIGTQGDEHIGVEEVARQAKAIPYEILCGLGPRVVRIPVDPERDS